MPTLLFDGECGFCRHWVRWLEARVAGRIRFVSYQESRAEFPHIPEGELKDAVHFVAGDGAVYRGAAAIFHVLAGVDGHRGWLTAYTRLPLFAPVCEAVYKAVARNRYFVSTWMRRLWGRETLPASHGLTANLYLRALGSVYLVAFVSLGVQILGLVGRHGILPATGFLATAKERFGGEAYFFFPTLAWLSSSDVALRALCFGGAAAALGLIAGIAPFLSTFVCWLCFLSVATVGGVFTQYQWESLLCEAGFLAIFLAPRRLFQGFRNLESPAVWWVWLHRWLVFRLMLGSGISKLASGDPSWRDLTAMAFHYETQPLPTPLAWYFNALPMWVNQGMTLATFFVELVLPFLFLAPRRPRKFAFYVHGAFQLGLIATGNFAYFNLLTLILGISLLEDKDLRGIFKKVKPLAIQYRKEGMVGAGIALFVFGVSAFRFISPGIPELGRTLFIGIDRLQIVGNYGLFAVMTKERNEIEIEGSGDGKEWKAYAFRWKPGDVNERPKYVAPHQPRLDWQMWFAALSTFENELWLQRLALKLLEGEPEVVRLFARNPFPESPPRFIRMHFYKYRFSSPGSGEGWWTRESLGAYSPVIEKK